MRFKAFMARYQGIILMALGCVAAVWLALTKQLTLYIHPRYVVFTLVMSLIGLCFVIISLARTQPIKHKQHGAHRQNVKRPNVKQPGILPAITMVVLCTLVFGVFMVLRPTTLTSSSLKQRGINSNVTATANVSNAIPLFGGGDYSRFGVRDWAGLLAQTTDPGFYTNKSADIVGFVSAAESDPENVFYVSRFIMTCCAVDSRPIGVPVYAPGWQSKYKTDSWVQVKGTFIANPTAQSSLPVVIKPGAIATVDQPDQPYVF